MSVIIGWDIGGAHLKAARVKRRARRRSGPGSDAGFGLGLDSLEVCVRRRPRSAGASADRHRDYHDWRTLRRFRLAPRGGGGGGGCRGVWPRSRQIVSLLRPQTSTQAARTAFIELGEAAPRYAADIASANWHASAACSSRFGFGKRCSSSIGSTTADLIPIVAGRVAAVGYSDSERLASGELMYTGRVTRSFVMALASLAKPFRGAWTPLMNEYFASSADIHRILDDLPYGADKMPTADGREKTVDAFRARLAPDDRSARRRRAPLWSGKGSPLGLRKSKYAKSRTRPGCACPVTMWRSRRPSSRQASGRASRQRSRADWGGPVSAFPR